MSSEVCIFCHQKTDENVNVLTAHGAETILACAIKRKNEEIQSFLQSKPTEVSVHNSCRKRFNDLRCKRIKTDEDYDTIASKKLRSNVQTTFSWKAMCFLCCERVTAREQSRKVSTLEIKDTLLSHCDARGLDPWTVDVKGRLSSCIDLVAEEAVYHVYCYSRFSKHKPMTVDNAPRHIRNPLASSLFDSLCDWVESGTGDELFELVELRQRMVDEYVAILCSDVCDNESAYCTANDGVYSVKHLKRKLLMRYGDHIFFATRSGKRTVLCFRNMCSFIVTDYKERLLDEKENVEELVKLAAKLIASQIREMTVESDCYPTKKEMASDDALQIPSLLQSFLTVIVTNPLKRHGLAHGIVQAARPKTFISPLLLGLALKLDSQHGSENLLISLSRLGFSVSYDEVVRYKQSLVMSEEPGKSRVTGFPQVFTQWVADNVDHNLRTLDGLHTFHGAGVISVSSSLLVDNVIPDGVVPRLKRRLHAVEVAANRGIPILEFDANSQSGLRTERLLPVEDLQRTFDNFAKTSVTPLNLVWHLALLFQNEATACPNWQGFMSSVCVGDHSPPAVVDMLPLIDMKSTDESCIYSILKYVCEQAQQLGVEPCITFDQPLWQKATDISKAANLDVVVRLGGFHTLMSFMGSLGSVMAGSGLEQIFGLIYGADTVQHIVSGKAYARAVRAHCLLEGALVIKLLQLVLPTEGSEQREELKSLTTAVLSKQISTNSDSLTQHASLMAVEDRMRDQECCLSHKSRTARLWIKYIHYVRILKQFLTAERTCNWKLHLSSVAQMLNLFAATGHNNYARSARLYVQSMLKLPETHPTLHTMFDKYGFHSVRRTDKYWAGVSTDLTIEQTMMRSIKSRGGLTRGRGMTETVRSLWINTAHHMAEVDIAMSSLLGMNYLDSSHVELGSVRVRKDYRDLQTILQWLTNNNPFDVANLSLRSLSTGVTSIESDGVNCDIAEEIGVDIQRKWDNLPFTEIKFCRVDKVRNLAFLTEKAVHKSKDSKKENGSLFHRLLILAERSANVASYFRYEMTSVPTALFKDDFMRKPNKPDLAKCISKDVLVESRTIPTYGSQFVLDGGSLLHKVRWCKDATFGVVFHQYLKHIITNYGRKAIIVFDGYSSSASTKDHEHRRRVHDLTVVPSNVDIQTNKKVVFEQNAFLANDVNKQSFIKHLASFLEEHNFQTKQSESDADTMIVSTALELAEKISNGISVVAEDTDIMVLLTYHLKDSMCDVSLVSEVRKGGKPVKKCVSIRAIQANIGHSACQQLLTIHALGGCDTTSALYGVGKATVFRRLVRGSQLEKEIDVMQDLESDEKIVAAAGLKLMMCAYGGEEDECLDKKRFTVYCKMVSSSLGNLRPQTLPPTERAAYFHVLRCHHQAVTWKYLSCDLLDPLKWGWKRTDRGLEPVMTDLESAPADLLKIVRCKCKSSCKLQSCSCQKSGMKCLSACLHCRGVTCSNPESFLPFSNVANEDPSEDCWSYFEDDDLYFIDEEVVGDMSLDYVAADSQFPN